MHSTIAIATCLLSLDFRTRPSVFKVYASATPFRRDVELRKVKPRFHNCFIIERDTTCYNVIMKDEVVHIRIDKAFKKELEREAEREGRSLSNYLLQLLKNRAHKEKKQ